MCGLQVYLLVQLQAVAVKVGRVVGRAAWLASLVGRRATG